MVKLYLTFVFILACLSLSQAQTFELERPVPDSIEANGGYLYAESHVSTSNRAHGGVDYLIEFDTVYAASSGIIDFLF